jgi:hypothetical protein
VFFFIGIYGFKTYDGYKHDPHNVPVSKGLAKAAGIYNVEEFSINNDTLLYSATDPVRWQDVVFEKWATISIGSNRPVIIDSTNTEKIERKDEEKNYESEGSIGRHYYSYSVDTVQHILTLLNKNKHYVNEQLVLHYNRPDSSHIVLSGINENKDSVHVVLGKVKRKFLLVEGRRKPQKL